MSVELPFPLPRGAPAGQRIRFHRRRLGLKQRDVAARAGINQGFLSELERGRRNPSPATLRALAEAMGLPLALLTPEGPEHDSPQPLETRDVPLLGAIPAGPPSLSQESPETFPVLRHLWGRDRYCLRLSYDSMEPTLKPGDIVLVEYRRQVDPEFVQGRICACLLDGEPTLKRISVESRPEGRLVILRGDNPRVQPILVDDTRDFSIQGIVLAIVSRDL